MVALSLKKPFYKVQLIKAHVLLQLIQYQYLGIGRHTGCQIDPSSFPRG